MSRVTPSDKTAEIKPCANYRSYSNAKEKNLALKVRGNQVTTSKYNPVTFIPKNLYEQFSRLANVYFLIISGVQLFTNLSPTSRYATAGPFAFILFLNMVREIWEDSKRHLADDEVNNRKVELVQVGGTTETVTWKLLALGDIVQVNKNSEFPADLILLASSGEQGMSYIDTCNLDGETNLKIRNSLDTTKNLDSPAKISTLKGYFEYEPPNNRLYTFTGKLVLENKQEFPVDSDNILLRGSTLRNTDWIIGQVIYTGPESKIMMNAQKGRMKQSNVEHIVNYLLVGILIFEMIVVTIATIGMALWVSNNRAAWYLPYVGSQTSTETAKGWVTFLILLNNYVPISLYISLELAKSIQGQQINWDLEMYHPQTDTPALTRTTNLNEELGQIQYIFSDKTGTLTQNVMEFRKCFIAGTSFGFGTTEIGKAAMARGADIGVVLDPSYVEAERAADPNVAQFHRDPKLDFSDGRILQRYRAKDADPAAPIIRDFFRILSVSHTVIPEGDLSDPAKIVYQAESPDEGALTSFAKAMGWFFCGKTSTHTTIRALGVEEKYEVLNINKFNSARKRMSVVCRTPERKLMLYCKGADNVMFERLRRGQPYEQEMKKQLAAYATEGLRTLVLASRELSEEEWAGWNKVHKAAATALQDREGALERAAEAVEVEMTIVGATAIEDKLQVGVPDAIATLARAGLRIWVLTGDKQETAENIGFACELLRDDMTITRVSSDTPDGAREQLRGSLREFEALGAAASEGGRLALVVDGKALLTIMADDALRADLLRLAQLCRAVIACRVSPSQKREIVAMVRRGVVPEPMTLAIGDGANDVPMITEAHVGVGISGNEGMQAVRSADYAIAQFRYLKRLMLVHGRNNYRRVAVVILYSLYKQMAFVTTLFLFNIVNGWSGTALFDTWILTGFNTFYTFLPIIIFGFMEQDVSDETALTRPQLYMAGQRKENFNMRKLATWVINGLVHCALVFSIPYGVFSAFHHVDLGVFGTSVMNAMALSVNMRLVLEENHISWLSHFVVIISFLAFYIWAYILDALFNSFKNFDNFYGVAVTSFNGNLLWMSVAVTFIAMNGIDVAFKYSSRMYMPTPTYIIQEQERLSHRRGDYKSLTDLELNTSASRPAAAAAAAPNGSGKDSSRGGGGGVGGGGGEQIKDQVLALPDTYSPRPGGGSGAAAAGVPKLFTSGGVELGLVQEFIASPGKAGKTGEVT